MTPGIRPLIAGNWKMNGTSTALDELELIGAGFSRASSDRCDGLICVPATLISRAAAAAKATPVSLGGQDCHRNETGAHTGDISAAMLKDAGATYVIVGHSERRTDHGETDADVHAKAGAAVAAGLITIVCVGETEAERNSGQTLEVLSRQISGSVPRSALPHDTVVAYEPVWAIGTGKTATVADVGEAHQHIREQLADVVGASCEEMRILYGGSVKPANARELLAVQNVDGALVGGASLKATDFLGIAEACGSI